MTVQRYDPKYRPFSKGMEKDILGYWVEYADYQKLESQTKELKDLLNQIDHAESCWCRSCQPEFKKV